MAPSTTLRPRWPEEVPWRIVEAQWWSGEVLGLAVVDSDMKIRLLSGEEGFETDAGCRVPEGRRRVVEVAANYPRTGFARLFS